MRKTQNLLFFSYKSAAIFFSLILIFNLVFVPLLSATGVNQQAALSIVNSIGISSALTFVIVWIERKLNNKKHVITLFLALLVGCSLGCFLLVFG
ncbi:hypothetical protein [Bacillus sp. Au-Bac7]|uniref:hypothetical protein n=1 Tax=Bacillus sp. Au-Bac7 TaxID=2906458 RepID=UPI001E44886B|nr:hypothetical protein [Bacillus sp. Au-Bac7]MCE4048555.1 hypothetical protein [Bacillus sp. Au-Bac7]